METFKYCLVNVVGFYIWNHEVSMRRALAELYFRKCQVCNLPYKKM